MALPLTTGSAAEHLQPGIREIIGTRLGGRESHYSRMYNVETTMRSYEDYLAATGLPVAVEKHEGENIQSFNPVEGDTARLTPKVYAIGFEITEEAYEDDLYTGRGSMIRAASEDLADAFAERTELEAHRPFNSEGFDGSTFTVLPDGSGFFATSHSPITGAMGITQANRPSINADLNITSYRTMLTAFRRYRDDQGKRVPGISKPAALEVPPELEWVMRELESVNRPDTANRVDNVSRGLTTGYVNPYLDDPDSWFGRAPKHSAYFLWRWRPRMDAYSERRSRVAVEVLYGRFSYGPIHWLGYYGSPGE